MSIANWLGCLICLGFLAECGSRRLCENLHCRAAAMHEICQNEHSKFAVFNIIHDHRHRYPF